ncbi:DNA repair protein RadA (plasmid) [Tsukamurella tyrosinosolvens]|uniref:DNA repair protein RadA n=1 Tax=Tsukamurella tyrosinosolvens TaxID=57704 RepID=A0A1H4MF97_TSUTY|nr:DNA repair protein RadA [Tsukamurella tyrosinosolvens]KXO96839.1 DNA repair protein RadA [Tsukamurella tyrosinosolvens]SEB81378.1 DNA repair protein RadA/Sms [Tsukamurella tyrosinosolvens]VEI01005.1 DNA repair protein RadA [Tsukamurella tyrosinosolvens]
MAKAKVQYTCTECGHTVAKWVGRCPSCGAWSTMEEGAPLRAAGSGSAANVGLTLPKTRAVPITKIDPNSTRALPVGIGELDRVLGGGIVPGSVILLAGEPGVGKSTLLLEVVHRWATTGRGKSLYVTGEESAGQVRLRAERTGALSDQLYLAAESDLGTVLGHVEQISPTLMVVDSVQTLSASGVDGVHGGVTQVRAITATLTSLAKASGIAVILVGHVTKDGAVAGPRSLEHLVDVVLSFEGDKHSTLRMVRGIKNRFGASDEVGCFEQRESGIVEVTDPSGLFLHHRDQAAAGTAVTVGLDGKRPMLGELQALVTPTPLPSPRRAVSGLDSARVAMVLAVLSKHGGIENLPQKDVYAATVGGMKITEPAADLALALAVASGAVEKALRPNTVVLGEVGLAGEVRRVTGLERRLAEAARLGFTHAIVPPSPDGQKLKVDGIHIGEAATLADALRLGSLAPTGAKER